MSIQEPAWLKRTRPCPFFSQGRCLFADSCNFLHDVKVRNAIDPVCNTVPVKQLPLVKPVINPPSVVVDCASPCSDSSSFDSPASPAYGPARYSGLLSVLSDVIGPSADPSVSDEVTSEPSTSFSLQTTATLRQLHNTDSPFAAGPSLARLKSPVAELETASNAPAHDVPALQLTDDTVPGAVLSSQATAGVWEEAEESVAQFMPVPHDDETFFDETIHVEGFGPYVIGSDDEEEEETEEGMDDDSADDSAVLASNRHSVLSSFTGVSLLASPPGNLFGEPSVASPIDDGSSDLLSPVTMSAKLCPFPIAPFNPKTKRGDSIDSGYADSWTSPPVFPRTPPRSFRSSAGFFPPNGQESLLSSTKVQSRRVSYDVRAVRPFPHNAVAVIEEEASKSEENEDHTALTILDAYDSCLPEEQGEDKVCNSPIDMTAVVEQGVVECNRLPVPPSFSRRFKQPSSEHIRPTSATSDLEACSQPSFVSDDKESFVTAFSTQPSFDDFSDASTRVSPVKPDSLLSFISRTSTPETSLLSYDDHSHTLLDHRTDSLLDKSCDTVEVIDSLGQAIVPDHTKVLYSGVPSTSQEVRGEANSTASIEHPEEVLSQSAATAKKRWSQVEVLCIPNLARDAPRCANLNTQGSNTRVPDLETPMTSMSMDVTLRASSETMTVGYCASPPVEGSNIFCSDSYSSEPNVSTARTLQSPQLKVAADDSISSPAEHTKDLRVLSSLGHSPDDVDRATTLDAADGDANSSPPSYLTGLLDNPSLTGVGVAIVVPLSNGDRSMFSELSFSTAYSGIIDVSQVQEGPVLVADDSCPSEYVIDSSDSEPNSFTQSHRLTFPLPPLFLPAEFAEHSALPYAEEASIPSVIGSLNDTEDETGASLTEKSAEDVQRLRSGSDLTERAGPSQRVWSSDPDMDFVIRRNRAVSDITVKAVSSPVLLPEDTSSGLLSGSDEESPRADSVQSLYDRYFDDATYDGVAVTDIQHSSFIREDPQPANFPDDTVIHLSEAPICSPDSSPGVFPPEFVSGFDVSFADPTAESPQSEPVFQLQTIGRRPLLDSSLRGSVSTTSPADTRGPSYMRTPPSNRLQARQAGSTMVPLGFRRLKSMPVAKQSWRSVLPVAELREVLRIRTDITHDDLPVGCSSEGYASSNCSPLPTPSLSAPPTNGLRPLRLSTIINNHKRSPISSSRSSSIASSVMSLDRISPSSISHSPTVSSVTSLSRSSLLSSSCPPIPEHVQHTLTLPDRNSAIQETPDPPRSVYPRLDSRSISAPLQQLQHWRLSHYRAGSRNYRLSRRTSTLSLSNVPEQEMEDGDTPAVAHSLQLACAVDWTRPASALSAPVHAIATPKATLLFAIASDDVEQVHQVLENGEAGPNDPVGPQSALAFTLTNDKLTHKHEIVKALLAYGADPSVLKNPTMNPSLRSEADNESSGPPPETTLEGMDPATRYYVARADAAHTRQTSRLIYRSFFRPLTRVRYDVIGQDWALEQLFRVLSMHSQKLAIAPIVVLLCGPSGHGKSLLARKFGYLLDVPTHTVNMTTLRSANDIWQSYSMSPYEEPSSCTLAEFLVENEGKRCVVVLDEIEKIEDQKALWSLLMPWELGRCSLETGRRHIDARNVIWLGTSNIGHELVFEHHQSRSEPEKQLTREEYLELTEILRPRVSHHLGASLVSRVTTVLPFVPFTLDERKAIAAEAVYALAGDAAKEYSSQDVESLVTRALPSYHHSEGARSLHRAISNLLIDVI